MGTLSGATTAGTPAESGGDEPPIRFRGDEADLFLAFDPELKRTLAAKVFGLSPHDVEDACEFAWIQFFRYQPSREEGSWQGWLFRTAQREAWKLGARHRSERTIEAPLNDEGREMESDLVDPRNRIDERIEFLAAMEELRKVPERVQQVVIVRSQMHRQQDVADVLGISLSRVNHVLATVSLRVNELAERRTLRDRPVASPRAARLRELEDEPPSGSGRRSASRSRGTAATAPQSSPGAEPRWPSTTTATSTAGRPATTRSGLALPTCPPAGRTIGPAVRCRRSVRSALARVAVHESCSDPTV